MFWFPVCWNLDSSRRGIQRGRSRSMAFSDKCTISFGDLSMSLSPMSASPKVTAWGFLRFEPSMACTSGFKTDSLFEA